MLLGGSICTAEATQFSYDITEHFHYRETIDCTISKEELSYLENLMRESLDDFRRLESRDNHFNPFRPYFDWRTYYEYYRYSKENWHERHSHGEYGSNGCHECNFDRFFSDNFHFYGPGNFIFLDLDKGRKHHYRYEDYEREDRKRCENFDDYDYKHHHGGGNSIPEPGTAALFGVGLIGVIYASRKKNK